MSFKILTVCALFGVTIAGLVPGPQIFQAGAPLSIAQPVLTKQVEDYDPHPQYSYAYDIQDGLTGDSKNQQETRDGDVVRGQYSLTDPDGIRRTVDYTADPINGFNAVVSRQPLGQPILKAAAPVAIATQPLLKAAPLAYAPQPLLKAAPALISSY